MRSHDHGFGPLVSGLICYRLLKTRNVIGVSLLGTRPVFSVAVCIVPLTMVCLTQARQAERALKRLQAKLEQ